jgi:hypothetical protein
MDFTTLKESEFCQNYDKQEDLCDHFKNKADVVGVVRCKECKYCEDMFMSGMYCNHPDNRNPIGCRPDDFCNDGERKGDNG